MTLKSLLFVPATYPERFSKAANSSADAYIIDLEDTVESEQKSNARLAISKHDAICSKPFWVRINDARSSHFEQDLVCVQACQHLAGVVLPKTEVPSDIERTNFGKPIIAMIETPIGMATVADLARTKGLFALGFGALDLGEKLGVVQGSQGAEVIFDRLRSELVLQSAVNGLAAPIETIFADFKDLSRLGIVARRAYEMGFGGQFAIHPSQLDAINQAYTSHSTDYAFAQAVYQHYHTTGESVFVIDGQMVDLPIILWAKKLLNVD